MTKKMIITACCLLLAGAGLVGIGILSGGTLNFYYALGSKVITDARQQYEMQTETVESFDSIDVKLDGLNVKLELVEGDAYSVTYPQETKDLSCSYQIENGVLQLKTKKKHQFTFFQINFLGFEEEGEAQTMKITVPNGTKMSEVKVDSSAGNVTVNKIDANKMHYNLEYGDMEIVDCKAQAVEISNESGDVFMSGITCDDCVCALEYGKLTVEDSSPGRIVVQNDSGNVKIRSSELIDGDFALSYGNLDIKNSNVQTANFVIESGNAIIENVILGQAMLEMSYGSLTAKALTVEALAGKMESGDAKLSLSGTKTDYTIRLMVESGDIRVADEKTAGGSYQYDAQASASKITLENEYGDICLDFDK